MKDILFEWNSWWQESYHFEGVCRDILLDIIPWIDRKEIISITGIRRGGKTTLLYEIIDFLIHKKKISLKNILFIKADDDRIDKKGLIDAVLDEYHKWMNPAGKIYIFIDEIQEIDEWQKTIKRLYDLKKDIKFLVSGSNSFIIKEDLSVLLAGRCAYFEIFPFNFCEFLKAKKVELPPKIDDLGMMRHKDKIRHFLIEYLNYGSFPEVVFEEQEKMKHELLQYYFDSIFYRDVIKRKSIRNPAKLERLIKYFLQNIAVLTNFTKIAKTLELTTDSVVEYVKALEDAYLIFSANLFEFSYKKQIINPKKIYCADNGIRNFIGFKFSEDIGRLYENCVFLKLRMSYKEIFYWKKKNECDFIVKNGKNLYAIQVCFDIKASGEREIAGLAEAMNNFKLKEGLIITENVEKEERISGKKIIYIPLWKWMLTNNRNKK